MLIGIFKKSRVLTPFILILLALLLWADSFIFFTHHSLPAQQAAPLFNLLLPFIQNFPLLQVIAAWCFLIIQAFLVNHIVTSRNLMDRFTLLPALIYVVLMSGTFEMMSLNPVLFANFFLLLALNKIFDAFPEKEIILQVYNVGLLVALAGLFYLPALLFLFLAVIALFTYTVGNIRGLLATLMGFATPFLFLGVILYLADVFEENFSAILSYQGLLQVFSHSFSYYTQAFLGFLGMLFLVAFLKVTFGHFGEKPIRIRKRFHILVWFFFIALLSTLVMEGFFEIHYALMVIPLSMFLSVFFMEMKKNLLPEIIFTLLLALILTGKLARLD